MQSHGSSEAADLLERRHGLVSRPDLELPEVCFLGIAFRTGSCEAMRAESVSVDHPMAPSTGQEETQSQDEEMVRGRRFRGC